MADHSTSTIIINLNHFAIKAMNDSGYMEACGLLSEALILLDKSTSLSPVGMSLSELLMREVSPIGSPSTLFGMYSMTPRVSSDQNLGIDSIVSTSLPIRRAVQITGSEKRRDHLNTIVYDYAFLLDGVVSKDLWKAILLYNNGLSLHLHGLERGDNELLRQALLLYQTVYSTIIHESRSSVGLIGICTSQQILPRFQSDLLILLASALCHNMAAIHGEFWNAIEARLLRCELAALVHWQGNSFPTMHPDDFVFFHLGIFFAIADDFRIAPAA